MGRYVLSSCEGEALMLKRNLGRLYCPMAEGAGGCNAVQPHTHLSFQTVEVAKHCTPPEAFEKWHNVLVSAINV